MLSHLRLQTLLVMTWFDLRFKIRTHERLLIRCRSMESRVFGQYLVTGVLGEGGMGIVYAAEHTLLDRPAAVKVLHPKLSGEQEIVTRFFNEARAATAIRHPGIVEIYDFGWTDDRSAFVVM